MTELGVKIHIILDQTFQSKRRSGDAAHEIPAHLVEDVAEFRIELKQTEPISTSSPCSSSRRFDQIIVRFPSSAWWYMRQGASRILTSSSASPRRAGH